MCGRYTVLRLPEFVRRLELPGLFDVPTEWRPRYNAAPTQDLPVVLRHSNLPRLVMARWGLVPFWAKDPAVGVKMINARAETVAEKPAFREALRRRRCLVPADGFYEWKAAPDDVGRRRQPYYIRLRDEEPFAMAGLWESWRAPDAPPDATPLITFTIVTTSPNGLLAKLHNRMPVLLAPQDCRRWLDAADVSEALKLLRPFPAELMEAYEVSTRVGNPRHDEPSNIVPVRPDPDLAQGGG